MHRPLLHDGTPLACSRLWITIRPSGRRGKAIAIDKIAGITEAQILRQKRDVGNARGITVAVDLEAAVVYVVIGCAGALPGYFVVAETAPATGRFPDTAADAEHFVKVEKPAHSRLPEVATERV